MNEYLAEEQEHLVDLLVQRDAHIEHLTNQLMLITEQNRNLQNDLGISNDQLNIAVSLCVVWKNISKYPLWINEDYIYSCITAMLVIKPITRSEAFVTFDTNLNFYGFIENYSSFFLYLKGSSNNQSVYFSIFVPKR